MPTYTVYVLECLMSLSSVEQHHGENGLGAPLLVELPLLMRLLGYPGRCVHQRSRGSCVYFEENLTYLGRNEKLHCRNRTYKPWPAEFGVDAVGWMKEMNTDEACPSFSAGP